MRTPKTLLLLIFLSLIGCAQEKRDKPIVFVDNYDCPTGTPCDMPYPKYACKRFVSLGLKIPYINNGYTYMPAHDGFNDVGDCVIHITNIVRLDKYLDDL